MPDHTASFFPFPPPDPSERAALAIAAAYLARAGTTTATRLLGVPAGDTTGLWASLQDQMLAGAALCDGLVDLVDDAMPDGGAPPAPPVRVR